MNSGRFNVKMQPNAFSAMLGISSSNSAGSSSGNPWFLDSGTAHHFTPDLSALDNLMPFLGDDQVMVGNGKSIDISHFGNFMINSPIKPIKLDRVFHTPAISKQLPSVSKLCHDSKAFVEFYPTFFLVKDLSSRKTLLQGHLEDGLHKLRPAPTTVSSVPCSNQISSSHCQSPAPVQVYLTKTEDANLWLNRLEYVI